MAAYGRLGVDRLVLLPPPGASVDDAAAWSPQDAELEGLRGAETALGGSRPLFVMEDLQPEAVAVDSRAARDLLAERRSHDARPRRGPSRDDPPVTERTSRSALRSSAPERQTPDG